MSRFEYRARWRREGRTPSTRITQSEGAARRKVIAVLAVDRLRDEISGLQGFPALSEPPVVQRREVGQWEDYDQEPPELTEGKLEEMREWAEYRYPDEHGTTGTIIGDSGEPHADGIPF